jgi:Tfp pilus assembly protein PilP
MKLVKASGGFLAVVLMSLCFAPMGRAQAKVAKKPRPAAKAKAAAAAKGAPVKSAAVAAKAAPAKPAAAAPAPAGEAPAAEKPVAINQRDPFAPLVNEKKPSATPNLPPGKAGLVIATVRVDGTVRAQTGMIAIVSNPNNSVYFVREGDRLYDGDVEKIGLDGVTFRESSKDAFGHAVERMVTKRIYASAGEQQ